MKGNVQQLHDVLTALLERKKAGRLKRLHFFVNPGTDATAEEICEEINRMESAPDMPDVEVLGPYSPKF